MKITCNLIKKDVNIKLIVIVLKKKVYLLSFFCSLRYNIY